MRFNGRVFQNLLNMRANRVTMELLRHGTTCAILTETAWGFDAPQKGVTAWIPTKMAKRDHVALAASAAKSEQSIRCAQEAHAISGIR
eukprot:UN05153